MLVTSVPGYQFLFVLHYDTRPLFLFPAPPLAPRGCCLFSVIRITLHIPERGAQHLDGWRANLPGWYLWAVYNAMVLVPGDDPVKFASIKPFMPLPECISYSLNCVSVAHSRASLIRLTLLALCPPVIRRWRTRPHLCIDLQRTAWEMLVTPC